MGTEMRPMFLTGLTGPGRLPASGSPRPPEIAVPDGRVRCANVVAPYRLSG
jgi:hypothetical protein